MICGSPSSPLDEQSERFAELISDCPACASAHQGNVHCASDARYFGEGRGAAVRSSSRSIFAAISAIQAW